VVSILVSTPLSDLRRCGAERPRMRIVTSLSSYNLTTASVLLHQARVTKGFVRRTMERRTMDDILQARRPTTRPSPVSFAYYVRCATIDGGTVHNTHSAQRIQFNATQPWPATPHSTPSSHSRLGENGGGNGHCGRGIAARSSLWHTSIGRNANELEGLLSPMKRPT